MLKEYDCVAARLLHTMGVNIQALYAEVMKTLGREGVLTKEDSFGGS